MHERPHVAFLSADDELPDPRLADARGLAAVGGELTVERLREAYRKGIFPWSSDPVTWWSPDPRAVIELDGLRISRRLRQKLRTCEWAVTRDAAFEEVVAACAAPRQEEDGTWIDPAIQEAYLQLHQAGDAHSLEVWGDDGGLIGGIYGVVVGAAFCGESMFYRESDASKVALVRLIERLREGGFELFDAQVANRFTLSMGAIEIPRDRFLERLAAAAAKPAVF